MGHRTITISDEAYMILSSLKREKESFTDVIKRVFNEPRRRPLAAFTGGWQGSEEELERIFGGIEELWKTYEAGSIAADLGSQGEPIGARDPMIAGIAMRYGEALLTQNTRHFSRIPLLRHEEW